MPLRLLNYCIQVWLRWRKSHADEPGLPLIVPLVLTKHVEYVLATQPDEYRPLFVVRALRRNVPGRGGEVMNYVEQLIERGRREGLPEGELKGQVRTIEAFLERDVSWSTIEAATGIDEAAFRKLMRDLKATDNSTGDAN